MSKEYRDWLDNCPRYVASTRLHHRVGRYVYYTVLFVVLFPVLAALGISKAVHVRPPRIVYSYINGFKIGLLGLYSNLLRPLFGDGGGEIGKAKL